MNKLIFFISICLVGNIVLAEPEFRCDYKYKRSINGWLKLHEIPANWHEARLRCTLEGAVLASPLDAALNYTLVSMMKTRDPKQRIFTGIHATFSRGDYFSIEGVPLWKIIPRIWAPSEPDNKDNDENCLVLDHHGALSDEKCSDTYNYICYKRQAPNMVVNACGTVDPEYIYDERTNSCYKFHDEPRTWSRAYMTCAAEGGYLTIINSETEAQVIRELFAKHPPGAMIGNFWKDIAFVGFHDWKEHGTWLTIHGQTLKEAGYDKFSPGEPNNATTGEYCGGVFRTALFDDLWCENVYAFICEKDPDSLRCPDGNNVNPPCYPTCPELKTQQINK